MDAALDQAHARGEAAALGEVFPEMGYLLRPDGWLIPDVSITHAGQTAGPDDYLEGAPAIAIEIASRGNSAEEIAAKVALYPEHGAGEVWVIYPKLKQTYIYIAGQARIVRELEPINTPLLPGFELRLQDVLEPQP